VRDTLRFSLTLGIICVISAVVLSGTYNLTYDRIEQANVAKLQDALEQVLPGEHEFSVIEGVRDALGDRSSSVTDVYVAVGQGFEGAVISASPKGYAGPISIVVGVTPAGEISGVSVISQSETPGLGAEVTRDRFTSEFVGLSSTGAVRVRQDGGSIDAVTGATISSRAVASGVRDSLEAFSYLRDKGLLIADASSTGGEMSE
jgi:electron transport complex protein RnfG